MICLQQTSDYKGVPVGDKNKNNLEKFTEDNEGKAGPPATDLSTNDTNTSLVEAS